MAKILIIDDDRSFVELATIFLEKENHEVVSAYDGHEGLRRLKEENPDLVLLDIMMPGMDGWDVQHRIETTRPGTKVSFLTALDHLPDLEKIGVSDYIVKRRPFTKKDLVSRVENILKG